MNKSFLEFSHKLTEEMVKMQKEASQETGSVGNRSRRNSIVSNSSFQFLSRIGNVD